MTPYPFSPYSSILSTIKKKERRKISALAEMGLRDSGFWEYSLVSFDALMLGDQCRRQQRNEAAGSAMESIRNTIIG